MNTTKPFTKLFSSIVTSSIWTEDSATKVVWVTMLAICDANGDVWASVGGLARMAGVTRQECEVALGKFLAEDPDSRTKDHGGRRITPIDGGWKLLNYVKYRELGRTEDRREYFKQKKREERAKKNVNTCQQASKKINKVTYIEAEAEAEAESANSACVDEHDLTQPITGMAPSPKTPEDEWRFDVQSQPWAGALKAGRCKIGPKNWQAWQSLLRDVFNGDAAEAVKFAASIDPEKRWPDHLEAEYRKRRPDAKAAANGRKVVIL